MGYFVKRGDILMEEVIDKQIQKLLEAASLLMVEIDKTKLTVKEAKKILEELQNEVNC